MGNFINKLYQQCTNSNVMNFNKQYIYTENPHKYAITIGINYDDEQDSDDDLSGCTNDLNNINQFLLQKCNFSSFNILTLYDTEATKYNIETAIKKMVIFAKNNKNSELWLSFSGHGGQENSFIEKNGKSEFIYPVDHLSAGYISDDWLKINLVNSLPTDCKLFVLMDCCHSGTNLDLPYKIYNNKLITNNNIQLPLANIIKISGCRDNQISEENWCNSSNYYLGTLINAFLNTNDNFTFTTRIKKIHNLLFSQRMIQIPVLSFSKQALQYYFLYDEEFEIQI